MLQPRGGGRERKRERGRERYKFIIALHTSSVAYILGHTL
jgi:hypothetical protein